MVKFLKRKTYVVAATCFNCILLMAYIWPIAFVGVACLFNWRSLYDISEKWVDVVGNAFIDLDIRDEWKDGKRK